MDKKHRVKDLLKII